MSIDKDKKNRCLHELFEEQARRSPQAPAVVGEDGELTYEELDRRAERLAAYLQDAGVGPDTTVGIYMERCSEYVIAILATLKAGGAFVPLELAYPDSLLGEVVADCEPRVILTKEPHAERLPREQTRLCMEEGWEQEIAETVRADGPRPDQENLAFVAYSSGTTGKPKGIANPHRAAVRAYLWRFGISDYRPGDRVGCNVFFVWEVLRPLLKGATSYVVPDEVIYDPDALIRFLEEHRISEVLVTPSLLGSVLDASGPEVADRLSALRVLWLNGEVVTKTLARRAVSLLPDTRVLNVYSIAETHEVAAGDVRDLLDNPLSTYCPVGQPIDPDFIYLLDEDMRPVPDGAAGELYVGGECLARGYVNLPEKTAERFLADPFSSAEGARMYRTGDKGRLLPDGSFEILGRTDFMVKIRGYSVELGAVEAAIEKHLAVGSCVVVAEGEEGEDKRLVAYLVPSSEPAERRKRRADWSLDPETGRSPDIRRCLQKSLPHYMIPAVFVEMETPPLQETTGKIDRGRLPPPPARIAPATLDTSTHSLPADAPRSEKEALLVRVWEHVLRLEEGDVDRDDDFFEIGGHSLAAAELLGYVDDAFGVRLSMGAFLENPTVAGLCDAIEALQLGESDGGETSPEDLPQPAVDLRAEAVLDPAIVPKQATAHGAMTLQHARRVFLTGATGFLGAFLLDWLLSQTDAEVHCLVRPRGDDPMASIRGNLQSYDLWQPERARRIVPVAGDLGEPLLGMSEEDFDALAREVDIIIHAGAAVNMIYPYTALKPVNVDGTHEVLRLACLHETKPVHHVSTNGIFPSDRGLCEEDVDLDSLAEAREDGYGQSKWVAERLVWEAAERGLPVCVYRPGNVSGHSESGVSNPKDFLGALLVGSLRIGRAPEIEGWRLEMTPVDFVSQAICHLAGEPEALGQVFHLANPDPVPADTIFSWIEDIGYPLERLPYTDWLEEWHAASRRGSDDGIGGVLHTAAPEARDLRDDNTYDDSNTRRVLQGSGLRRPEIDASLLGNYVRYFVDQGWVEAPSGVFEK